MDQQKTKTKEKEISFILEIDELNEELTQFEKANHNLKEQEVKSQVQIQS